MQRPFPINRGTIRPGSARLAPVWGGRLAFYRGCFDRRRVRGSGYVRQIRKLSDPRPWRRHGHSSKIQGKTKLRGQGPLRRNVWRRGMTLIEILVVLAIAGLMVQVAAIGFGPAFEAKKIRATNQIVSTIHYAYNRSRVYGIYMRLEIDFEKGGFSLQEAEDAMYLPATDRDGRIRIVDESEVEEREDRDRNAAERYNESLQQLQGMGGMMGMGGVAGGAGGAAGMDPSMMGMGGMGMYAPTPAEVPRAKAPIFAAFKDENSLSGLGEAIELPDGVKVYAVRTGADPEEIKEGKAYIYFFPSGRTQRSHILISEDEGETGTTIKIQPLTGKVEVVPELEPLELPEDFKGGKDDLGRSIERRSF